MQPQAARQHQARGFATGEEARVAGHLPDLAEDALGRVEDREVDVGAYVEDADFDWRLAVSLLQEGGDILFLARIEWTAEGPPAGLLDVGNQGRELVAVAAAGKTVNPSAANLRAIAAPMKSPAPITATVALRAVTCFS